MKTIALLTDFGSEDNYVGIMKGVILKICPDVRLVDLTHSVEPQNLTQGALLLQSAYKYFPDETIFLCVVDPGVGSNRDPIVVRTSKYFFVGPDNGLFSPVFDETLFEEIYTITNEEYFLKPVSSTFHGRDIFAPVAAHIAKGVSIEKMGRKKHDYVRIEIPQAQFDDDTQKLIGEVIAVDRFGNLITNIDQSYFADHRDDVQIIVKDETLHGLSRSYAQKATGETLAIIGSKGFLEISINRGSAKNQLQAGIGDKVEVQYIM